MDLASTNHRLCSLTLIGFVCELTKLTADLPKSKMADVVRNVNLTTFH